MEGQRLSDGQGFGKPQGSGSGFSYPCKTLTLGKDQGFCKGYSRVTFYFKSNFISQNSMGMWVRVPRVRVRVTIFIHLQKPLPLTRVRVLEGQNEGA